jgi:TrmH family RNA methyltransferase
MPETTPHHPITSRDNSSIKQLRSLSDAKHRKKEKAFLIEGLKMVEEALRDNLSVRMVVATPSLTQHHGKGVLKLAESKQKQILWISGRLMDSLAESKTPQPIMAIVDMKQHSEEGLLAHDAGLIVACWQLQDPGNLGTIIRTAEAAGAAGVVVVSPSVDPFNPKAVRASMGSILRLPIATVSDLPMFILKARKRSFQTVATALTGDSAPYDIDFLMPTVVILGQEGSGLPSEIMTEIDRQVRIPMVQTIESLNVATAAAVMLYEAVRQRMMRARAEGTKSLS